MVVASIFDEDVRNDMNAIGWNPFNTNETATLNSSKVSFYKGVPVFRTAAGGRSGSFGAIFLTHGSGVDNAVATLSFYGMYAGAQFGLKQLIGYGINQIW